MSSLAIISFPHSVERLGGGQEKQCLSERLQNRTANGMREKRSRLAIVGQLARRLDESAEQAIKLAASLRHNEADAELLSRITRLLRRCQKLQTELERMLRP